MAVVVAEYESTVPIRERHVDACEQIDEWVARGHGLSRATIKTPQGEQLLETRDRSRIESQGYGTRGRLSHIRSDGRKRHALQLRGNEEVRAIVHEGSTQRESGLCSLIAGVAKEWDIAGQRFISAVIERRAMQVVGAASRDRVDLRPGEIPVSNVVR